MIRKILCLAGASAAVLLLTAFSLYAQQPTDSVDIDIDIEDFSVGVYVGYSLNFLDGSFAVDNDGGLATSGDCGLFEEGDGSGFLAGVVAELPIFPQLRFSLAAEIHDRSGRMSFPCIDPAGTRMPDGSVVEARTEHIAEIRHQVAAGRALLYYRPFYDFPLDFGAGLSVALPLNSTYDVREEIVTPANAEFVSGGQVRNYGSGSFAENGSPSLGLTASIKYLVRAGDDLFLMPEISAVQSRTDEVADPGFSTSSIRATLGLVYRFGSGDSEPPPIAADVPPEDENIPAPLRADLVLDAVSDDGSRSDTLTAAVRYTVSTRLFPLLTYVFFDSAKASLPARYRQRTAADVASFSEENLRDLEVLEVYSNLLDIVGSRLRRFPAATIMLTATEPEAAGSARPGELARRRASTIQNYLVDVWRIAPERIDVAVRPLPEVPTSPGTPEGRAENTRVEISSNMFEVVDPVVINDTVRTPTTSGVRLRPSVSSGAGIESWKVTVAGNGSTIEEFSGSGSPPSSLSLRNQIPESRLKTLDALDAELQVRDESGREKSVSSTLPVRVEEKTRIEYGSGYYSLILFDFNSARLRPQHLRTLELVNERVSPGVSVKVLGYTDVLGDVAVNARLSQERAAAVVGELDATIADIRGVGEEERLYDNSLPEGRFYSRCVTILAEKE